MPRQIWKNKPDSKLALPQLAELGAVVSKEMHGNHLIAQHENGTAIIKDAKVNLNAPLSSLHCGIQAYKDASGNKRLFVSTADGTYPVGWSNIKYDDEVVNTIFYDVARNSSSNNIAGLIYEEDGKLKIYIGVGYETGTEGKPVSEGIVPNGALKVACDWTQYTHSFISKVKWKSTGTNLYLFRTNAVANYIGVTSVTNTTDYTNWCYTEKDGVKVGSSKLANGNVNGTLHSLNNGLLGSIGFGLAPNHWGNIEYFENLFIFKGNLTQSQLEGELAKDISLPNYHHQENSIINTYGIQGMSAMYLFQPALTSAEVDAELGKDIYLPKTQWDIPDYLGNS